MATTDKEFPPENKISPMGWTHPQDVVGDIPVQRDEDPCACEQLIDLAWRRVVDKWVGARFAIWQPDGWSTGQDDLFGGGGTPPDGSWPKRIVLTPEGEVFDVRAWIPRPSIGATIPTPVSYDATPGGPGNHYKGLGHQAKHGGALFGRDDGKLWPTPQHHDSSPGQAERALRGKEEDAAGGYRNLNDEVVAFPGQMFPTPRVGGDGESVEAWQKRQAGLELPFSMPLNIAAQLFPTPRAGKVDGEDEETWKKRQAKGDVSTPPLGLAVKMMPPPRGSWPTPMSSEARHGTNTNLESKSHKTETAKLYLGAVVRQAEADGIPAGGNPKTGPLLFPTPTASDADKANSASLAHAFRPDLPWSRRKDQKGDVRPLWPTPTANDTGRSPEAYVEMRQEMEGGPRDSVSSLAVAAKMDPGQGKTWPSPVASDAQSRRKSENWAGNDLVSTVTDIEEQKGAVLPKSGGQLNPNWVEPLMGYRCGTTLIEPEAAAWLKIDSKRLKASDLKKLHSLDEHVEEDVIAEEEVVEVQDVPKKRKKK